jgi:hypothetical protein
MGILKQTWSLRRNRKRMRRPLTINFTPGSCCSSCICRQHSSGWQAAIRRQCSCSHDHAVGLMGPGHGLLQPCTTSRTAYMGSTGAEQGNHCKRLNGQAVCSVMGPWQLGWHRAVQGLEICWWMVAWDIGPRSLLCRLLGTSTPRTSQQLTGAGSHNKQREGVGGNPAGQLHEPARVQMTPDRIM